MRKIVDEITVAMQQTLSAACPSIDGQEVHALHLISDVSESLRVL